LAYFKPKLVAALLNEAVCFINKELCWTELPFVGNV